MGKPDALLRWADHGSGQGDNDNLTILSPELFQIHTLSGMRFKGNEQNILWEVQHSLCDDTQEESVLKAARELQKNKGQGMIKSAKWSESDGLLMFRGKIYVPKDRDLRCRIVEQHHNMHIVMFHIFLVSETPTTGPCHPQYGSTLAMSPPIWFHTI
jgi:hypothetical protein